MCRVTRWRAVKQPLSSRLLVLRCCLISYSPLCIAQELLRCLAAVRHKGAAIACCSTNVPNGHAEVVKVSKPKNLSTGLLCSPIDDIQQYSSHPKCTILKLKRGALTQSHAANTVRYAQAGMSAHTAMASTCNGHASCGLLAVAGICPIHLNSCCSTELCRLHTGCARRHTVTVCSISVRTECATCMLSLLIR